MRANGSIVSAHWHSGFTFETYHARLCVWTEDADCCVTYVHIVWPTTVLWLVFVYVFTGRFWRACADIVSVDLWKVLFMAALKVYDCSVVTSDTIMPTGE